MSTCSHRTLRLSRGRNAPKIDHFTTQVVPVGRSVRSAAQFVSRKYSPSCSVKTIARAPSRSSTSKSGARFPRQQRLQPPVPQLLVPDTNQQQQQRRVDRQAAEDVESKPSTSQKAATPPPPGRGIPPMLRFTKDRELQCGRVAMFGWAASILGELVTGKGALAQIGIETGLPLRETEPLVLLFILSNIILPLLPASGQFVEAKKPWWKEEEEARAEARRRGPLTVDDFWDFLAFQLGLSKENELLIGRLAQLGFATSLVGEALTGMGPLAQVRMEENLPMQQIEPLIGLCCVFFFLASLSPGTGEFKDDDP